jgi:hypothetical protein
MKPRHHLLVIVLACTLAALACTQALAWWTARAVQQAQVMQRDSYLLHSLRTAAENYLAIGLSLDQMQALQGLIERERASFAQVQAIDIFNASGSLLYSTDLNTLGSPVPAHWRERLADNTPWSHTEAGQHQLGTRFDNDLGQAAGGIVLTVSASPTALTLAQWQERGWAALQVLAMVALSSLGAWAGVALGLRRLLAPYAHTAQILHSSTNTTPAPAPTPQHSALEQAALHTQAHWRAAQQHAQQRLRQLQELDDAQ